VLGERVGAQPRHLGTAHQLDLRDGGADVVTPQVDLASVSMLGLEARVAASFPASAIEKQPAWAAPMSSSGLVPSPSSKRDGNE
jgi:hypothetical protein